MYDHKTKKKTNCIFKAYFWTVEQNKDVKKKGWLDFIKTK